MSCLLPRPVPLALAISLAFSAGAVFAQSASPQIATEAARELSISAQPLGDALNAWARQTRMQLAVQQSLVAGKTAPAVSGNLTPRQALNRLLAGSGLEANINGSAVIVRPAVASSSSSAMLAEVVVTGKAERADGLPEAYAGGQVARGGQVGMLGNKDVMDTPFSQISYTNKTIQDQQAQTIQDVLSNDPSILTKQNSASDEDSSINIRGFSTVLSSGAGSLNGLAGMSPLRSPDMGYIERVEVLKGPSALLNGMAASGASGPGGSYNLRTKQAGDEPLTELTTRYGSRSQLGAHLDVGRRFGAENQFGVRFNGAYRKGDTPVDPISAAVGLAAINLDYRGERVRLSGDFARQSEDANPQSIQQLVVSGRGGGVIFVPNAPDAGTSLNPSWSNQSSRLTLGMLRGEVDIADNVTAYGAIGKQKLDVSLVGPRQPTLRDTNGTFGWNGAEHSRFSYDVLSMQGGLHATAKTGPVDHALGLNLSQSRMDIGTAEAIVPYTYTTSLNNPIFGPALSVADPGGPIKSSETRVSSIGIADTLSILDKRVELTAGIRYQEVEVSNFSMTGSTTSSYAGKAWSPALGLIVKPWQNVSLYANYIENLQAGTIVDAYYANGGDVLAPYVSKQQELGAKLNWGAVTTTLAVFQITQPNTTEIADPAGGSPTLALNGEVRIRGIELNNYGELMRGVRLMGGVTLLHGRQTKTQNGQYDGNREAGIPVIRTVIGGEWDTPFLQGLTLNARVTYTGNQVVSSEYENLKIPSWAVVDLGARYKFASSRSKNPITVRFNVDNLFGKDYWSGVTSRYIHLAAPRTFRLSATFVF